MSKINRCLIIISLFLFIGSYSYAHILNIYVTNTDSNTVSVFGFENSSESDFIYRQSRWLNPDPIHLISPGIKINPYTDKHAYIFSDDLYLLHLDESGNINSTEPAVPQLVPFHFIGAIVFGLQHDERLMSRLYLLGGNDFHNNIIQILNSNLAGMLTNQEIYDGNNIKYPDSAVFATNFNGSVNAYILSKNIDTVPTGFELSVEPVDSRGYLRSPIQTIRENERVGPLAVTPDSSNRFIFIPIREKNWVWVYERDDFTGKLTFLYTKVSEGQGPIKVVPSNDGRFIFVLYADNNTIGVYSIPEGYGYVTLLYTRKLTDNYKGISGNIADGAFGSRYDNNYLYVLVEGSNILLSYKVTDTGQLIANQAISAGGYGSKYLELRNAKWQ